MDNRCFFSPSALLNRRRLYSNPFHSPTRSIFHSTLWVTTASVKLPVPAGSASMQISSPPCPLTSIALLNGARVALVVHRRAQATVHPRLSLLSQQPWCVTPPSHPRPSKQRIGSGTTHRPLRPSVAACLPDRRSQRAAAGGAFGALCRRPLLAATSREGQAERSCCLTGAHRAAAAPRPPDARTHARTHAPPDGSLCGGGRLASSLCRGPSSR